MKKLGYRELVTIGLGIIIGSGVITLTGFGIGHTDTGVGLAYILAGILFMFSMLPTLIVGVTIPRTSYSYTVSKELLSPVAGGMFLMIFFIGRIIMAFFGVAFANYVVSIIPNDPATPIAVGIVTLFYIFNLFGVQTATKVQKFLNILLVLALGSFAVLGCMKAMPDALTVERLFPNGFGGLISAVAMFMFSMGGGLTLLEFGGNVEKPQRTLLYAALTVTAIATLLFAAVGFAGASVLPYEQVANQPLTFAAQVIYSNKAGMLFFIIGGCLMAIMTTINGSLMWYCNTMIKGVEDGWFPKKVAAVNRFGAPYVLLTIFWIIGIVPILLGANVSLLSTVGTGLALLFYLIPNFALINLPKKYPEQWKASRFYIKEQWKVTLLTLVCSGLFVALIIYNFMSYSMTVLGIICGVLVVCFLYVLARKKYIPQ